MLQDIPILLARPVAVVPPAALDLDFSLGVLDSRIVFARASVGTYFDNTGTLRTAAAGVPRFDCGERPVGTVNTMRNSVLAGAVAANGVETITNGDFALDPVNAAQNTIQNGWQWVSAGGSSVAAYSPQELRLVCDGVNAVHADTSFPTLAGVSYTLKVSTSRALPALVGTARGSSNILNATTAVTPTTTLQFVATGTTTWLRFSNAASGIAIVDTVSVLSAGKIPTNMSFGAAAGLEVTVVGTGTEDGLAYFDTRFQGTATGGGINITFDAAAGSAAEVGQTLTSSLYVRRTAGSLNNVSGVAASMWSYNAALAILTSSTSAAYPPTTAALGSQRVSQTWVTDHVDTAWVRPVAVITVTNGAAIDVTLRIGGIQLQRGAAATAWVPSGSPNLLANSMLAGGVVGTPGTAPTGFSVFSAGGLTRNVAGYGTINGEPYVDFQFVGTASGTFIVHVSNNAAPTPCAPGASYTHSASFQLVAGSLNGVVDTSIGLRFNGGNNAVPSTVFPLTTTMTRRSVTSAATAGNLTFYASFGFNITSGAAIDFTIRQTMHQIEAADAPTPMQHYGVGATGTARPLGLLVEESRTNSVKTNVMAGAVVGGALPNNWAVSLAAGLTTTVAGLGTENGINVIDVRVFGTTNNTVYALRFDASIPGLTGQAWAISGWARFMAGTSAGVTNWRLTATISAGSVQPAAFFTPGPVLTRYSGAGVLTADATLSPVLFLTVPNGAAVDFTLRIGMPQLELGAFATSVIPTSTVAVTRAVDAASMPVGSWLGLGETSFAWDGVFPAGNNINATAYQVDAGTSNMRNVQYLLAGSQNAGMFTTVGGVASGGAVVPGAPVGVPVKVGGVFGAVANRASVNGGAVVSAANTSGLASGITTLRFGSGVGTSILNGTIRRLRHWPVALSDGQLQQATR